MIILCVAAVLGLIFILFWIWDMSFVVVPIGSMLVYAIYVIAQKQKLNKTFLVAILTACTFSIIGLVIVLLSVVDDMNGASCSGLFGVKTACVDNAELTLFILFYNPFIAFSTVILFVTGVVLQIFQKNGESKKLH